MAKFLFLLYFLVLTCSAVAQTSIVPYGSNWKYLDNGSNQGTVWREANFSDLNWNSGDGKFGYGINDAKTEISFGTTTKKKFITTYFRKTISNLDPAAFSTFTGQVKRDDGAVIYVNGVEVYRTNLPAGAVSYNTLASSATDQGKTSQTFTITPSAFVKGTNVIAVEIHQDKLNTTDMAFDLDLSATPLPPPTQDTSPPAVTSINRQNPSTETALPGSITFRATFNEPVTGVTLDDFFSTGTATGSVTGIVSISSSTYDITVNASTEGILRLDLKAANTGIVDLADNAITAGFTAGQTYTIQSSPVSDTTPPTVVSSNRQNPTNEQTNATALTFRVTFSEAVTGVNASDFSFTVVTGTASGMLASNAVVAVGTSGAIFDVTASSVSGSGSIRLDLKDTGTGILDLAGNPITQGFTGGQSYTLGSTTQAPSSGLPLYFKSSWKYLDNGTDQGAQWRTTTFDDSQWKSGNGEFGYGDGDEGTVVSYGSNAKAKYITTYFRKQVSIPPDITYNSFNLRLTRDDGAVIYINGTEVYRSNMPTGAVSFSTLASTSNGSTVSFSLPSTAFKAGDNVIAVELHQNYSSSSDVSFDLEVIGSTNSSEPPPPLNSPLVTRGPYLQVGNQNGVTIRWRTDMASDSKIEVGTTLGSFTISATNLQVTTEHEVRISGLQPKTKYFYRIGSTTQVLQSGSGNFFNTAPEATSKDKIRIAVLGDCGKDSNGNRTGTLNSYLNYTGNTPAELLLLLGDNAYLDGTDADYQKEFFTTYGGNILKNHMLFPAPGNHDYHMIPLTTRDAGGYYGSFSMPTQGECGGVPSNNKAFYSYNWGNIHFVSLDSYGIEGADNTKLYDTLGVQVQWLKKDLAANNQKWTILYWHHPPHSMGSHNSDTEGEMTRLRNNFIRIIERYGVDMVLSGHSHDYERSYLLNNFYGPELTFDPSLHAKSMSSAKYDGTVNSCPYVTTSTAKNNGTVYIVAGSAGASGTVQAGYPHNALPFAVNDGGMVYLEVEDNRLDAKMLRKDGTVFDQFTIMQDVNTTKTISKASSEPATLSASWVGSYFWSTGETTRSITVNPSTSTTYQVTDPKNCLTDVFTVNPEVSNSLVNAAKTEVPLQVYPNPIQRGTALSVKSPEVEPIEVFVTDMAGRILLTKTIQGNASVDTSTLPGGMYILSSAGKAPFKKHKFMVVE